MNERKTLIEDKIAEAKDILKSLKIPERQQNKLSALTLLSLAGLKASDDWSKATKRSMTLSKEIMEFVNEEFDEDYKANTRGSFRKIAIKPFLDFNLIELNPDDPSLSSSSSKTHYALSDLALETIRQYGSSTWGNAIEEFIKNQFPENITSGTLLGKVEIKNYKSILDGKIELGRFNVFIGANGCGKSNILESLAMAGAVLSNDATFEGLYSRGIRSARPNLIHSSFLNLSTAKEIEITLETNAESSLEEKIVISAEDPNDIYTKWVSKASIDRENLMDDYKSLVREMVKETLSKATERNLEQLISQVLEEDNVRNSIKEINKFEIQKENSTKVKELLSEYAIYDLNTKSLRGISPADSRKTPLGINGEGLDLLISNFNSYERSYLKECDKFFDWLEKIITDNDEKNKLEGLKPGRSTSTLYFKDKFMQKQNNTLSAENSNEGILHVLFYLALFISNKTPTIFAIDNIETALNPRLCQGLIEVLAELAKKRRKQVLITTHNPAVLDGLNLFDDEQRLFEVYRTDDGHTKTRRIQFKKDLSNKPYKLSEMWTLGSLGAVPVNF